MALIDESEVREWVKDEIQTRLAPTVDEMVRKRVSDIISNSTVSANDRGHRRMSLVVALVALIIGGITYTAIIQPSDLERCAKACNGRLSKWTHREGESMDRTTPVGQPDRYVPAKPEACECLKPGE